MSMLNPGTGMTTDHPTVAEVMTQNPITVTPATSFREIVRLLRRFRLRNLLVVDGGGHLVGVVSESDALFKEERAGHALEDSTHYRKAMAQTAATLMSSPALSVPPHTVLPEAARIMRERGVHILPVVDELDRPVGVVTRGDLLEVFLRPDPAIRHQVLYGVADDMLSIDPASLEVEVSGGVVTLRGELEQRTDITLLTSAVSRLPGVVGVTSELTYRSDDQHPPRD